MEKAANLLWAVIVSGIVIFGIVVFRDYQSGKKEASADREKLNRIEQQMMVISEKVSIDTGKTTTTIFKRTEVRDTSLVNIDSLWGVLRDSLMTVLRDSGSVKFRVATLDTVVDSLAHVKVSFFMPVDVFRLEISDRIRIIKEIEKKEYVPYPYEKWAGTIVGKDFAGKSFVGVAGGYRVKRVGFIGQVSTSNVSVGIAYHW